MLGYIFEWNRAQLGRQVGGRFLFLFLELVLLYRFMLSR